MSSLPTVVSIHTERLHDDDVWNALLHCLQRFKERGIAATLFVYPFRAAVAGRNVTDRVRSLLEQGIEIAQHTHFYKGSDLSDSKENDLTLDNIRHCLRRDYEALAEAGAKPRGFTSGGWVMSQAVLDELAALNLEYDCTGRPGMPNVRDPAIISLLTTARISRWLLPSPERSYQIVYFHDYDLLRDRARFAVESFMRFARNREFLYAADLAKRFTPGASHA